VKTKFWTIEEVAKSSDLKLNVRAAFGIFKNLPGPQFKA